jgi:hypothetical protein
MIRLFKLVLDDNQRFASLISTDNIGRKGTNSLLLGHEFQVKSQRYTDVVREVVGLCKPGCEDERLVAPRCTYIHNLDSSDRNTHIQILPWPAVQVLLEPIVSNTEVERNQSVQVLGIATENGRRLAVRRSYFGLRVYNSKSNENPTPITGKKAPFPVRAHRPFRAKYCEHRALRTRSIRAVVTSIGHRCQKTRSTISCTVCFVWGKPLVRIGVNL